MSRWITVANRLPFTLNHDGSEVKTSSGGLVSALSGVRSEAERVWIGSAPDNLTPELWTTLEGTLKEKSGGWTYKPVFLDQALYDSYYNRTCNDVLWPLLHYQPELVAFDGAAWKAYREVNERIAQQIAEFAKDDDLIWIHDFHLFLVPKLLRALRPKLRIGFFLHVPFPSSEVFRQLPVREEILDSLLHSDLVGFHDYSYLQHFGSTVMRLLGAEVNFMSATRNGRTARLGVFPVSIDTDEFIKQAKKPEITKLAEEMSREQFLFLGVDRLDYMKGLDLKLKAFRELLKTRPEYREKVTLLQVAVPTRGNVPVYQELAREVARLVGEINGEFATPVWTPIQYIHASVTHQQLLALYRAADALLVSSKRDGMNLVALEYIASQDTDRPGVVLLSEFAGAISTLSYTLAINPWDIEGTAEKMRQAMEMPKQERLVRMKTMLDHLKRYNATNWATSFIDDLAKGELGEQQEGPPVIVPDSQAVKWLAGRVLAANPERMTMFVDYDGTLTPIRSRPEEAIIDEETREALRQLSSYPWLDLVVVSGRDSKFLTEQLSDIRCFMAAEHGAKSYDPATGKWRKRVHSSRAGWYPNALKIMTDYASRVPHSRVEKKQFAIAWHYRQSPKEFGDFQARKLAEELELGFANMPVNVIRGKKVIEARSIEADKGVFARSFLEASSPQSFALAIGDDRTDEDLFNAIRGRGLSFKVGKEGSSADVALASQAEVVPFLLDLAEELDRRVREASTHQSQQHRTHLLAAANPAPAH
jgi:trehalose 6-phosphate synthase/phosphatase